jgi:hypothetical protein
VQGQNVNITAGKDLISVGTQFKGKDHTMGAFGKPPHLQQTLEAKQQGPALMMQT